MPKVMIVVKQEDSELPPLELLGKVQETMKDDPDTIVVMLDSTHDDLRPMVHGAEFEILYESAVPVD